MKYALFAFFGLFTLIMTGCGDSVAPAASPVAPPANNNSFLVTGGNYENSLFNSTTITHDSAYYYTSQGVTKAVIGWQSGIYSLTMDINFLGKKTGNVALGSSALVPDTSCINITYTAPGGTYNDQFLSLSGMVTISQYDATIGGKIIGTFSGSFADANNQTYTINNGKFSAIRGSDK